jgi:hypothetical protein
MKNHYTHLEPINASEVLKAESGEGCELCKITLFFVSIPVHLKNKIMRIVVES